MAGAVFLPLAQATVPSEVYCVWKAGADEPARDRFLEKMRDEE